MTRRPDTDLEHRILIAMILLIVILAVVLGGRAIWTGKPFP